MSSQFESGSASPSDLAESLFADYVARVEGGEELDFGALVKSHPECATELEGLHADWKLYAPMLEQAVPGLISGPDAVLPIGASSEPDEEGERASEELVKRLGIHVPSGNRYRFRKVLGRGGGGVVLKVRDTKLNRDLAMKIVLGQEEERPSDGTPRIDGRTLTRFVDEARISSQLNHPGIVPVHELGADDHGRAYFTMRLVQGDTFERVIERVHAGEVSLVTAVSYVQRVCEAMEYAHEHKVVHRDLKPTNVMVGKHGEVYVMDFGLARVLSAQGEVKSVRAELREEDPLSRHVTQRGGWLGSLGYNPPEQLKLDLERIDERSDVYSVGALLYHLLSNRRPLPREERKAKYDSEYEWLTNERPPSLAEVAPTAPAELRSIVERAMAPDPGRRFATMKSLRDDLQRYLEGKPVVSHRTGVWIELTKWVKRNRALSLAIGGAALFALAASVAITVIQVRNRALVELETDLYQVPYLDRRAEELWPPSEALVPEYEAWLKAAERLKSRLRDHRARLQSLERSEESRDVDSSHTESADIDRRIALLRSSVSALERFLDPELIEDVRARLAWARQEKQLTITDYKAEWDECTLRMSSPGSAYNGEVLRPQLGLVPLGPDPCSGLEEFAMPYSGRVPSREPSTGILVIDGESAIVFVFIPGGRFMMGAQSSNPSGPRFAAEAMRNEGPPHEVSLESFMISKYELTSSQWLRLSRLDAQYSADDERAGGVDDALTPVVFVNWETAHRQLAKWRLLLPTEAQWEYAARAGAEQEYPGGHDPVTLRGFVNVADKSALDAGMQWPQLDGMGWLDDGSPGVADIGSYRPNSFGLHDTLGNVWEWVRDVSASYDESTPRPRDGLRQPPESIYRVARGGAYINHSAWVRYSIRDALRSRRFDSGNLGLRPSYPILDR